MPPQTTTSIREPANAHHASHEGLLLRRGFLIPALILAALGSVAIGVRFVFLAQTKAALSSGALPARGSLGEVMSPKAGCLYFVNAIDRETFETFLAKSTDSEAKGFVISLLGWKHRADMLDCLNSLVAAGGDQSQRATLSVVAIEKQIPFPGRDFAAEFYRS
jgi:hypothetical protein